MNSGPLVVGLLHYARGTDSTTLDRSSKRITKFFSRLPAASQRRTVFIEGWPSKVVAWKENIHKGIRPFNEPFQTAIESAQNKGWNVVALDRQGLLNRLVHFEEMQGHYEDNFYSFLAARNSHPKHTASVPIEYTNQFTRERMWAAKVLKQAKPSDVIILHPAHVKGLVEKCKAKGLVLRTRLLDRPRNNAGITRAQILAVQRARKRMRTIRIKAAKPVRRK